MLEMRNVRMSVREGAAEKPIIRDITFSVAAGESLGLVGESGSGKSMTLKAILRAQPHNATVSGEIVIDDQEVSALNPAKLRQLRAHTIAMISQNPHAALNPVLAVERYLVEGMHDAQGLSTAAARVRARELLTQVNVADPERVLGSYPHQLSGGLLQRVVIAGAVAGEPRLLLADESTTALDVTTQAEVVAMLDEFRRERQMAMIFVTHDLDLAAAVCDRIAVMAAGEIVEIGTPQQLREHPLHPYTKLLMDSRPQLTRSVAKLAVIPGQPVSAAEVTEGCRFAPRCPWAEKRCTTGPVPLRQPISLARTVDSTSVASGVDRLVRCVRSEELRDGLARERQASI